VNRILYFSLLFILFSNCSFNSKSNFWTKEKKIIEEKKNVTIYKFSKDKKSLTEELNKNVKLKINSKLSNNSNLNNLDNNDGMIDFNGNLTNSSKYKFSKIKNFNKLEPDLIFHENGLFFFDNKGTILKFDNNSKLIWKKNIYTKKEKKLNPILFFASNKKNLIVTDSIGTYYSLDAINGKLLWKNVHSSPFNSQIKINDDKFFTVDFESTLNCISIVNGNKLWEVKTEDTFIKSIKKISLIIKNNLVIFNNSIGDITAVDIKTGSLVWQTPTQSSTIYAEAFKLKISDIISESNSIYFSNNMDEFYSLDLESGMIKWKQNINSTLRPTVVENLIFTISTNGMLIVMEKKTGNIVRITDVFSDLKDKERKRIKPIGFIVGKKIIYLSNSNGKLLLIDIENGKTKKILKVDNDKISRPSFLKNNLYVAKDNSIIKLN
tara:strand:+ start:268 stop:1575 length:1308 start_codon:yes stop_codon:yes gene_type:complete